LKRFKKPAKGLWANLPIGSSVVGAAFLEINESPGMTAYLLANHLLNFIAPAAAVAVLMVLLPRLFFGFFRSNRGFAQSIWAQAAIIFVANLIVLAAGLVVFGRDGKMATYTALVVVAALTYWVLIRGWAR
jgi:hypothetical protein